MSILHYIEIKCANTIIRVNLKVVDLKGLSIDIKGKIYYAYL